MIIGLVLVAVACSKPPLLQPASEETPPQDLLRIWYHHSDTLSLRFRSDWTYVLIAPQGYQNEILSLDCPDVNGDDCFRTDRYGATLEHPGDSIGLYRIVLNPDQADEFALQGKIALHTSRIGPSHWKLALTRTVQGTDRSITLTAPFSP